MAILRYVFRNIARNKLRSALTVLSVGFCLAMMTVLYGFVRMEDAFLPELAKHHRLIVMNKQGFMDTMPIANLDYVRSLPGVAAAIPMSWYLGVYKDEKMPFSQLATDPKEMFNVWEEFRIDPEQLKTWQATRNGCVIDRNTARRRGWKIGEHVPLKGSNFEADLDLVLCGIYAAPEIVQDLYFHWNHLDELLRAKNSPKAGGANILFVRAQSEDSMNALVAQIDQKFENSEHPTLTQSHQAFIKMFSKFVGNIQGYIRNIGMAVIFALTLVAANAMAMSMRERTTEIAVLKAIGFRRATVMALVLGESVLISLVGGVVGVSAGSGLMALGNGLWPMYIPMSRIAWLVQASGLGVAAIIGLVSGLVPAFRAARLSVIDGLRRVI
jgi:putative ABC transport system permease protein